MKPNTAGMGYTFVQPNLSGLHSIPGAMNTAGQTILYFVSCVSFVVKKRGSLRVLSVLCG